MVFFRLPKPITKLLRFLVILIILVAAFPPLYEIKSKLGIDIDHRHHTGTVLEQYTHGLFKCEWLYPYHCDRSQDPSNFSR